MEGDIDTVIVEVSFEGRPPPQKLGVVPDTSPDTFLETVRTAFGIGADVRIIFEEAGCRWDPQAVLSRARGTRATIDGSLRVYPVTLICLRPVEDNCTGAAKVSKPGKQPLGEVNGYKAIINRAMPLFLARKSLTGEYFLVSDDDVDGISGDLFCCLRASCFILASM
jgi:hypothetical protein